MKIIQPNWPAPKNIIALTTTRQCSVPPTTPSEPFYLNQIHSNIVIEANKNITKPDADGVFTKNENTVCAVYTADCLPILMTDKKGSFVAALHGGWKGLAGNIISNAVEKIESEPSEILVWLGPAIGPNAFEVREDVLEQFGGYESAFKKSGDRWLANIYEIARMQLSELGIADIYGGDYCTFSDPSLFYSYRREGKTGRMCSLIWAKGSSAENKE